MDMKQRKKTNNKCRLKQDNVTHYGWVKSTYFSHDNTILKMMLPLIIIRSILNERF
jgi:hypothetical protein